MAAIENAITNREEPRDLFMNTFSPTEALNGNSIGAFDSARQLLTASSSIETEEVAT